MSEKILQEVESVVASAVTSGKEFSFEDLLDALRQNGCSLRVAAGVVVRKHLESLEEFGIIEYRPAKQVFVPVKVSTSP